MTGASLQTADSHRQVRRSAAARVADWLYVLPLLAFVAATILVPSVIAIVNSFSDWNPGYHSPFVGLGNYRALIGSTNFHEILRNQAILLLGVPLWVLVPFLLAVLLFERVRYAGALTAIFVFPAILPVTMLAIAIRPTLTNDGFLNTSLHAVGLGFLARGWLSNPDLVKWTLIGVFSWAWAGIGVLIFGAALSAVPRELLEATRVEGGRIWHEIRYVFVPGIWPVILAYTFIQLLDAFSPFGLIFVLTSGGPGYSSTTIDYDVYQNAFQFGFFGLAAAEGVLLLLIVLAILSMSVAVVKYQQRNG